MFDRRFLFGIVFSFTLERNGKLQQHGRTGDMIFTLSESNVSLKLADIQRRCAELLEDSDNGLELTLEEPIAIQDGKNPYDLG